MYIKLLKYFFHRTEFPRVPEHEEVIETREVVAGVAGEPSVTMERREAEGADQNRDRRVETAETAANAGREEATVVSQGASVTAAANGDTVVLKRSLRVNIEKLKAKNALEKKREKKREKKKKGKLREKELNFALLDEEE